MHRGREKQRRTLLYDDPFDCGVCTLARDRKASDETRTISEVRRSPDVIGTYGLFAGHGGATAADLCARNFVPTLLGDSVLHKDPEKAIRNACQALEAFVLAKSSLDKAYYGTTLLFAMIKDQRLLVANIGNSRAVLSTQDGVQTITQEHDGSNAEEVARVRNAGGFFQDGKVNNLVRVTRSIGDAELKQRKHMAFPTHNMTQDIVIATPDIFCRNLSPRDNCLILATAEVWEHLSNRVVVKVIQESLQRQDTPHIAAKKVALTAMQSGAMGPLSVMVLVFPTGKMYEDKAVVSVKKRSSRPGGLRRHSSNAEQQARKRVTNTPAFVRSAQAEAEHEKAMQRSMVTISPIVSPQGSTILNADEKTRSQTRSCATKDPISASFLTLDLPPGRKLTTDHDHIDLWCRSGRARHYGESSKKRADSAFGVESVSCFPDNVSELTYSRQQVYMNRKMPIEKRVCDDREHKSSARAKTTMVSRISELTASGNTGDEISTFGSLGHEEQDSTDFIGISPSGPSKVRYREDGSIHTGRFGFLKDLGRSFVRRA